MPTIHVQPLGKTLDAEKGANLRDVLQNAGILLDYPCGGKGSCRQCRVVVDPPPESGKGKLKDSETVGGVRLTRDEAFSLVRRAVEALTGPTTDGLGFFTSILKGLVEA